MNQEILDKLQKESLDTKVSSFGQGVTDLQSYIVNHVGTKLTPKDNNVTVDMIVQVLAEEFPVLVFAIAEENYLKGFEEGLNADELYEEDPRAQQVLDDLKDNE